MPGFFGMGGVVESDAKDPGPLQGAQQSKLLGIVNHPGFLKAVKGQAVQASPFPGRGLHAVVDLRADGVTGNMHIDGPSDAKCLGKVGKGWALGPIQLDSQASI